MNKRRYKTGFTLIEMMVVVGIIAIMISLVMPATNSLIQSHRSTSAKNLVRSSLIQAQAYARKEQRYAGIRFQYDADGWETGKQYLILIEKVPPAAGVGAYEYRAVPNVKPTALPTGIMALSLDASNWAEIYADGSKTDPGNGTTSVSDQTTFCIIFSPTGQLVVKDVLVNRRDEFDTTLNETDAVGIGDALLYDDGWHGSSSIERMTWCGPEPSTTGLYVLEAPEFIDLNNNTDSALARVYYLAQEIPMLINIYTGGMLEEE